MLIYYKKVFLVRKPHNIYLLEGHFKITFSSVLEYNLSHKNLTDLLDKSKLQW